MSENIENIDAVDAFELIEDDAENHIILDVRNPDELEKASLNIDYINIPLANLAEQIELLAKHKDKTIICICHHGGRSMRAAMFLAEHGFAVKNLAGGIHACSLLDKSIPRY